MVIGIVGNYGNNNQGDESILEGILVLLEKTHNIERKNIIVFSNQPEYTSRKYGVQSTKLYFKKTNGFTTLFHTLVRNWKTIRKIDLLLVGGGGIFMDLYGREPFLYGMYGWIAKLAKTPVVLYGVGAGPIITRTGKKLLKSLAHLSDLVTVRDPKSKELLISIGVKSPVYVIGDPAFQVPIPENIEKPSVKGDKIRFGVTAVPFYNSTYWPEENTNMYVDYVEGMAANLDMMLSRYPNAVINFFSTKYPQDMMVTKDIQKKMKYSDRTSTCDQAMTHGEIVEFASQQDVVIGTRLHSLILALVSNTPVISVSYHHKVYDLMEMMDCTEYTIEIGDLNQQPSFFYESYHHMAQNWEETQKRFEQISEHMKGMAYQGMELVKQQFHQNEQDLTYAREND
ncbi:polysaccharide pyruvyl transferase family protein [Salinibacillus aidingensis]|uniref:Polysaccharide pyruvyl transferase family protein n=1 Tax=Salinibacillus aidingensis TaxID=237684 RepID=A0ABP3KX62_9BACI